MGNTLSKEAELKFNEETLRDLDIPDLFVNVWLYNYFFKHKPCLACDTFSYLCEKNLKEKWSEDWGEYDFEIGKFKKCDSTFINISNYSNANKWRILDELIEKIKNELLFNCKLVVKKGVCVKFLVLFQPRFFYFEMAENQVIDFDQMTFQQKKRSYY